MQILMFETSELRGNHWAEHLRGEGMEVDVTGCPDNAISLLNRRGYDLLVIGLGIDGMGGLDLAHYAAYRQPGANVIFVTSSGRYADGSIFTLASNASALIGGDTRAEDVAAMAEHFGSVA